MAPYHKILVAFDGSLSACNALQTTLLLAKQETCKVKSLTVIPPYVGDLELTGVGNIQEIINGSGQKVVDNAQKIAAEEDVHLLAGIEQGTPYERITHVAEEESCDLIVMGRRGLSHLERELMGGVTSRVIGHTKKNVMVIPDCTDLNWDTILVATDGSPGSEAATDEAINLAREHDSSLHMVSVLYTNDEFISLTAAQTEDLISHAQGKLEKIQARAIEQGVDIHIHVREGEPHNEILQLAADIKASLIVMGTYGRQGISKILMGSATERTIGYASTPVLIVH